MRLSWPRPGHRLWGSSSGSCARLGVVQACTAEWLKPDWCQRPGSVFLASRRGRGIEVVIDAREKRRDVNPVRESASVSAWSSCQAREYQVCWSAGSAFEVGMLDHARRRGAVGMPLSNSVGWSGKRGCGPACSSPAGMCHLRGACAVRDARDSLLCMLGEVCMHAWSIRSNSSGPA